MSDTNNTREMVEFLDESSMVGQWEMMESMRGFIIKEPMAFDPQMIPEGWKIGQIAGSHVHIIED